MTNLTDLSSALSSSSFLFFARHRACCLADPYFGLTQSLGHTPGLRTP